jgi:hypothetical protein
LSTLPIPTLWRPPGINFIQQHKPFSLDSLTITTYYHPTLKQLKLWHKEGTEPIIDTEARKVVLQLKGRAETIIGEYANEYVVVLTMNDQGLLVDEYMEFVDSHYAKSFFERLQAANDAQEHGGK